MNKKENKQKSVSKGKIVLAILVLVLVLTVVLILFSFFKPAKEIKNVLLISIDTCRADHLSCYGYLQKTTPNIDAIAADGVLFEHCFSPVPLTLPAHSTMLTGTNPIYHGVHDNTNYRFGESNMTLAEILQQKGFYTGAIVSTFVLDTQFGLNQGFDTYNDKFGQKEESEKAFIDERKGDKASELACQWLTKQKSKPFFLFLHYFDPHFPYEPPAPFSSDYSDNRYAGEIAFTDSCIGHVIKTLKKLRLYDSTLIIITADHGESRDEHSEETHGYFVYNSTIHVPLIFKLPKGSKGKRINEATALVDIVPTVCNLLNIDLPSIAHGKDLSYCFESNYEQKNQDRFIYCESLLPTRYGCSPLLALLNDPWKYIQAPVPELYDFRKDPTENENLFYQNPKRAKVLKENLKLILQDQMKSTPSEEKLELDKKSKKRLESLGYISRGDVVEDFEFDDTKENPKSKILLHEKVKLITYFDKTGQTSKAEALSKQLENEYPDYILNYFFLGRISFDKDEINESINYFLKFLSLVDLEIDRHSQKPFAYLKVYIYCANVDLARAFFKQQEFDKAEVTYFKAIETDPSQPEAYYNLGNLYLNQNKFEKAAENYIKALALNPDLPEANYKLGLVLQQQDKLIEAIEFYKKAIELKPNWSLAQRQFLTARDQKEKIEKAIGTLTESLSQDPNQPEVQKNIGSLFFKLGNIEKAYHHWQAFLKLNPDDPLVLNNLAYIFSTEKTSKFYNPSQAIKLAEKACELTQNKSPTLLDTLAIAYAAEGRLDEAIKTAQEALSLASSANQEQLANEIQSRLEIYKSKLAQRP